MKYVVLFSLVIALIFVVVDQDVFAADVGCNDPFHCYSLMRATSLTPIQGFQYELDSPDLWVSSSDCDTNIALSTG